jgi:hypothetical protein
VTRILAGVAKQVNHAVSLRIHGGGDKTHRINCENRRVKRGHDDLWFGDAMVNFIWTVSNICGDSKRVLNEKLHAIFRVSIEYHDVAAVASAVCENRDLYNKLIVLDCSRVHSFFSEAFQAAFETAAQVTAIQALLYGYTPTAVHDSGWVFRVLDETAALDPMEELLVQMQRIHAGYKAKGNVISWNFELVQRYAKALKEYLEANLQVAPLNGMAMEEIANRVTEFTNSLRAEAEEVSDSEKAYSEALRAYQNRPPTPPVVPPYVRPRKRARDVMDALQRTAGLAASGGAASGGAASGGAASGGAASGGAASGGAVSGDRSPSPPPPVWREPPDSSSSVEY